MPERSRNVGASVRQRLRNLARERSQPMELLLTRYTLERLLYRLSLSPHRDRFVLKGAMLLIAWFDEPHRATRDVDFLGFGNASHGALLQAFREIMAIDLDDGVTFDRDGLRIEGDCRAAQCGGRCADCQADWEAPDARVQLSRQADHSGQHEGVVCRSGAGGHPRLPLA